MKYFIILITLLLTLTVNAQTASKSLTIGPKTNDNKQLKFNRNSSTPPQVRWNEASGKLQFSNDGTLFKDLGSGGGGGEGGINILENPGFEDGITVEWSCTSGDCTETTSGADLLIGEKSLKIDANAVADTVSSTATTMPAGLYGAACEAKIMYKGGDGMYELSVVDGDGSTLNILNDSLEVIPSSTIPTNHSVFFTCPAESVVTGDPDKGNLSLKIISTSAAATALSVDQTYLGTLQNLTETTLPDIFNAYVDGTSSPSTVSKENVNWIDGNCTRGSTGNYTCSFVSGTFTDTPSCYLTGTSADSNGTLACYIKPGSTSTTGIGIGCVDNNNDTNMFFNLSCQRSTDSKQTVQVYKTIPKVAENYNEFSGRISSSGAASVENINWLNGNCTNATPMVCTFNSGIFNEAPNCQVTAFDNTTTVSCQVSTTSTTASLRCTASDDTNFTQSLSKTLFCQKAGVDYKTPIVQPMVLGQISGNPLVNSKIASAKLTSAVCSSSPCSPLLGLQGISSITRSALGTYSINFESLYYSDASSIVCFFTEQTNTNNVGNFGSYTTGSVNLLTKNLAGAANDSGMGILCFGY